jgi:hypothetical protein
MPWLGVASGAEGDAAPHGHGSCVVVVVREGGSGPLLEGGSGNPPASSTGDPDRRPTDRPDNGGYASQPVDSERGEARGAVCSFLAGFGLDPADCRDLVERLVAGALAYRHGQPDKPLAQCAFEHAEQAFEAWLAAVLGREHLGDLAPLVVGRAAFLLCEGPTRWSELVLIHDDLPAAFTDAMRAAVPPPTPVPAPGVMAAQSLESWSVAQAANLVSGALGTQVTLLTERRTPSAAAIELIDRRP